MLTVRPFLITIIQMETQVTSNFSGAPAWFLVSYSIKMGLTSGVLELGRNSRVQVTQQKTHPIASWPIERGEFHFQNKLGPVSNKNVHVMFMKHRKSMSKTKVYFSHTPNNGACTFKNTSKVKFMNTCLMLSTKTSIMKHLSTILKCFPKQKDPSTNSRN